MTQLSEDDWHATASPAAGQTDRVVEARRRYDAAVRELEASFHALERWARPVERRAADMKAAQEASREESLARWRRQNVGPVDPRWATAFDPGVETQATKAQPAEREPMVPLAEVRALVEAMDNAVEVGLGGADLYRRHRAAFFTKHGVTDG